MLGENRPVLPLKTAPGMIDEVDLVLHPLRSELNFPIGPKNLIEHAPDSWHPIRTVSRLEDVLACFKNT